jgi:hypothetical protein
MRTFSEYYNFYIFKNEKLSDIFVENVKTRTDRYNMMFSKLLKQHGDEFKLGIYKLIQEAIVKLKKDNIVVFALQTLKKSILKYLEQDLDAFEAFTRGTIQFRSNMRILDHYLSLPIPEIQRYNYANKDWRDVRDDFKRFEDEWKKSRVQWIDITDELKEGTINPIITYKNGYAWFDLSRPYCKLEGDAMGHCGNTASFFQDDTVLSYRAVKKSAGTTMARPSLTFILNPDGYLGEMKGRANEKPKEKYHDAIVDLLLQKVNTSSRDENKKEFFIKGIRGGGYLPENNFSINDLNETLKNKLFSQRPELRPFLERMSTDDNVPSTVDIINELSSVTGISNDKIVIPVPYTKQFTKPNSNFANILMWDNWDDLLDDAYLDIPKNLENYRVYVTRGDYPQDSRSVDKEQVMEFLETVISRNSVVKARIMNAINGWLNDYPEMSEEGININPNDIEGVYNLLKINDRDVINLAKESISDGEGAGIHNQILTAFKNGIQNLKFISADGVSFGVRFLDGDSWMDSPLYATFTFENVAKIMDSKTDPFDPYDLDDGDMQVPYYGFDGYDEDYAISSFVDQLEI